MHSTTAIMEGFQGPYNGTPLIVLTLTLSAISVCLLIWRVQFRICMHTFGLSDCFLIAGTVRHLLSFKLQLWDEGDILRLITVDSFVLYVKLVSTLVLILAVVMVITKLFYPPRLQRGRCRGWYVLTSWTMLWIPNLILIVTPAILA